MSLFEDASETQAPVATVADELRSFVHRMHATLERRTGATEVKAVAQRPGLSYCGYCTDSVCSARSRIVVVDRGLGRHRVSDDIMPESAAITCPSCHGKVALDHIALYQCKATVALRKLAGDELVREEFAADAAGVECVVIDMSESVVEYLLMAEMQVKCVADKKKGGCVVA
jgi:hypothetical protein